MFRYVLNLTHCQKSEDSTLLIKNLEVLLGGRKLENILIVDTNMHHFTKQLTNGIFVPSYRIDRDNNDFILKYLKNYILEFVEVNDVKVKIKNDFGEYIFDAKSIKDFKYSIEQIGEETYEGNLYLIDSEERKHQILGFDDENEKYVLNDLKWFSEYLMNHVEFKITVANNV